MSSLTSLTDLSGLLRYNAHCLPTAARSAFLVISAQSGYFRSICFFPLSAQSAYFRSNFLSLHLDCAFCTHRMPAIGLQHGMAAIALLLQRLLEFCCTPREA